jgi:hypothetical protein
MIGLLGADTNWQGVLHQEGVCSATECLNQVTDVGVLILDRAPGPGEILTVAEYVRHGGAVLAGARAAAKVWPELRPSRQRIRYLLPDGSELFRNVGIVDLETNGWRLPDARYGFTDSRWPAIVAGQIARGWIAVLPFEPGAVLSDIGARPRRFFADTPRFPSEVVSRVSRGEVRRLLANCLRWLLEQRGLPYVHLAYLPLAHRSVLGFRVDVDSGTSAQLEIVAELARRVGMKFSWFINVGKRNVELDFFRRLARDGHDVGLHCLRHVVHPDYASNRADFGRGRDMLLKHEVEPTGVVAPYGEWNPALERALREIGFAYSSEFGFAYDDLPSRPRVADGASRVLQIPVHPICTGRLLAARAVRQEVLGYFRRYVGHQIARNEPCLLYDHPAVVSETADVWTEVLDYGLRCCGEWTTLSEFARFWQRREAVKVRVKLAPDRIHLTADAPAGDCPVVVERGRRQALLRPVSGVYVLDELEWTERPEPIGFDPSLVETRYRDFAFKLRELQRGLMKHLQSRRM